tara:strand:+ start:862 stop:1152 length:291 start_codon:yes stop_codon:yes gene_type:complete
MAEIIDMNTPGWEGVNAESPLPIEEPEAFQTMLDKAIRRIHESEDGKIFFDWLTGAYLQQPTWAPGYTTDFGFYREGQNTLIREILMRSERAGDNG